MSNFLLNLLGLGGGQATIEAAGDNFAEINRGAGRGENFINAGTAGAKTNLQKVVDQYAPLNGATGMYSDALGLGGAGGNARATEAFQTGPGFDFARDQGIQAIDRSNAARGSFQSGGAQADVMGYATGLANQEYGGWLNRLMGASNTALSGTTAGLNNLANLDTGNASQLLSNDQLYTGARIDNNNMYAEGKETQAQGQGQFGGNLMKLGGKMFGYGGF